jgi:hypothetical protein
MISTKSLVKEIKQLIASDGYIYALCMILIEDFSMNPEKLHEVDYRSQLSVKEVSLLLGFLVQNNINFSTPDSLYDLIQMKQQTYELMKKLHDSLSNPAMEKIIDNLKKEKDDININSLMESNCFRRESLMEAIFYSGDGVYDFQFLEYLDKKYKYDREWLLANNKFEAEKVKEIIPRIKNILEDKLNKAILFGYKEKIVQMFEDMNDGNLEQNMKKAIEENIIIELSMYIELFNGQLYIKNESEDEVCTDEIIQMFCQSLLELFVITKGDFNQDLGINDFLDNFATTPGLGTNKEYEGIGYFNSYNAEPAIQLDRERYFVPLTYSLYQAVYESPFYWMKVGDQLLSDAMTNRGKVGEEIAFELLSKVFGSSRTYKSVKLKVPFTNESTEREKDKTDIDVLCILGSKALCIQVKSKKLTMLSMRGDFDQLQKDFKEAVGDAYKQGLIARKEIIDRNAKFFNENGAEITLSEDIDEVYIMGITLENYPAITPQTRTLLAKNDDDPYPLFLTMFDLELLTHYLIDPYDFLYYIRQRISLMDFFIADEEMYFLGYHLMHKLWKKPGINYIAIDPYYGQIIDRNYYPLKAGIEVSDEGDAIKKRIRNDEFDKLCDKLKSVNKPKIIDIIFCLLDWSDDAIEYLIKNIIKTKELTIKDEKMHDFSVLSDGIILNQTGLTYISSNLENREDLKNLLLNFCQIKKYREKADFWIGFGSLKNSNEIIDGITFDDNKWEYDYNLEKKSDLFTEGMRHGIYERVGSKIGRNQKCLCGSFLKYKKCCGRNK